MWIKSKIGLKLALIILLVNIAALLMLSFLYYQQFEGALKDRILLQLTSIKKLKYRQIEEYLQEKKNSFSDLPSNVILIPKDNSLLLEGDTIIIRNRNEDYIYYGQAGQKIHVPLANLQETTVLDISPSNPQRKMLAAFIRNIDHERDLVLISPLKKIHEIVLERTGMGESGETYIVGDDFKMRSVSRFFPNKNPLEIEVKTAGVMASMNGHTATGVFKDYRNIEVFSSYQPLEFYGYRWAILSEIDESEVLQPLSAMKNNLIFIGSVIFTIMLFSSVFITQAIVSPIVAVKDILNQMALGKLVPVIRRHPNNDEIGQMFQALDKHIQALKEVTAFADLIGMQKFDAEYKLLSNDDTLGSSLMHMRDKLREFNKKEEIYRKEKEKALWQGQEKERSRLSKELHDGLGPLLTTLKLTVSGIQMDDRDKEKLKKLLDDTITEVRYMSYNLMPQALLDFGVGNALGNLVDLVSRIAPLKIKYANAMKSKSGIPEEINIGIYRIAQEALNNALKYSQATEIRMSLTEFDDYISFYIKDNGIGFDRNAKSGGTGILNMKERVNLMNGTFIIDSSASGTTIEVEVPLPDIS